MCCVPQAAAGAACGVALTAVVAGPNPAPAAGAALACVLFGAVPVVWVREVLTRTSVASVMVVSTATPAVSVACWASLGLLGGVNGWVLVGGFGAVIAGSVAALRPSGRFVDSIVVASAIQLRPLKCGRTAFGWCEPGPSLVDEGVQELVRAAHLVPLALTHTRTRSQAQQQGCARQENSMTATDTALDLAITQIHKQFGAGSVMRMGENSAREHRGDPHRSAVAGFGVGDRGAPPWPGHRDIRPGVLRQNDVGDPCRGGGSAPRGDVRLHRR